MKISYFILFILFFCGCSGTGDAYPAAENAFDAAREFIDGCLKGDFSKAAFYMVSDEENNKDLLQLKNRYKAETIEQKREYHEATIIVLEEAALNDSVNIINYRNSYDKIARKVKTVLRNNIWQVDFKYTLDGNL